MSECDAIEAATQRIGAELLHAIEAARPADHAARLDRDPIVRWSRHEGGAGFLAACFRFVDVLPVLDADAELLEYLRAYVGDPREFADADAAQRVRALIDGLRDRFIAGATLADALRACSRLRGQGLAFTLDALGEAVLSEREAEAYLDAYLNLLQTAARAVGDWPDAPALDAAPWGRVPRLNVSVKLTSLYSRFDAIDPQGAFAGVAPRLRAIFHAARQLGASVNVDMEQREHKDLTLGIFQRILLEDEFRDWPDASITIQTYLPENRADLAALLDWVQRRGTPANLRVVKGAYWDYEVLRAQYRNWPVPVYQSKAATDADFEWATRYVLKHHALLRPAVAGHNVRSIAHAIAAADALGVPQGAVEFQTLYGLGGELDRVLAERGHRVRVYVPFGELVPGLAYLVRRLLEATSRSAFLRQMWACPLPVPELLAPPTFVVRPSGRLLEDGLKPALRTPSGLDAPFQNEPVSDFARPEARDAMAAALADVRTQFGCFYPLWIGGRGADGAGEMLATDPGLTAEAVGRVALASRRDAARAVRVAVRAFPDWAARPARERAECLLRAAEVLRRRRFELAAWEVFEEAKGWREADADVVEAIDYCEFYAREAARLGEPWRRNVPGETNDYFYEPLGVAVAITPWNFPLAILTGVVSAAAAAGNTVIMKPAEPASVVAAHLMEVWEEAGVPPGVIQFLPGRGEDIGEYLVRHRDVARFREQGHYVEPLIVADVAPDSPLAQEEIFGPLLCVLRAEDFAQAVAIANGTQYGLTGGVYTRNPEHIRHARAACRVGNLYVNRPITGAVVGRQPFGGMRLSGIGSKAGGPDYLRQFMQPKTFSENAVRRGFAPPTP